jgi:hypothetical protein
VDTETTPDATSVDKYDDQPIDLDMEFVRDQATADAVAALLQATLKLPPTMPSFDERLCGTGTDLGQVDTVTHFEGVTATGYEDRKLRCETHTLDLDELTVKKEYRDIDALDFSSLWVGAFLPFGMPFEM